MFAPTQRRFCGLLHPDLGEERKSTGMEGTNRKLMFHGMCLFMLGLLTGFAEQHFANVRMGLATHLEGVMNCIFLIVLGAILTHVRLSSPAATSWQETTVTVGFMSVGIAIVFASSLVLWGLRKGVAR